MRRVRTAAAIALLPFLAGCAVVGPASIGNSRQIYNEVINHTEDEQLLALVVAEHHHETAGMLAVGSVTANIRFAVDAGTDIGIGPRSGYRDNLVPLSAGVAYEENPTISYTPLSGDLVTQRLLSPVTLEQALLLSRCGTDDVEPLRFVIRRINGIGNPRFASGADPLAFDRIIDRYIELRESGIADIVHTEEGEYFLAIETAAAPDRTRAFLELLGCDAPATDGRVVLPIAATSGARHGNMVDIETISAIEMIRFAGEGIGRPPRDNESTRAAPPNQSLLLTIQERPGAPAGPGAAVERNGRWYAIDPDDAISKRGFLILRTLIGMRLHHDRASQATPLLTLPVGG